MKRPASQYYWGDWRRDTALQACSLAARGLWHEMNCLMHDCEPYGHLMVGSAPMKVAQLCRLAGVVVGEGEQLLAELESAQVFSRTDGGAIYSRRMVRDEDLRERRAAGGHLGAEHGIKGIEFGHLGRKGREYNDPGKLYAVQRTSGGPIKVGITKAMQQRMSMLRSKVGEEIRVLLALDVSDMGAAESAVHESFNGRRRGEWIDAPWGEIEAAMKTCATTPPPIVETTPPPIHTTTPPPTPPPPAFASAFAFASNEIPPIPPKGGKQSAVGLKAWLATIKAEGQKPIPEDDPVFAYAEEVSIPAEFLSLCWREFKARYSLPGAKRYIDWRSVFRKAVRGNWLKLWYVNPGSGAYELTTVGHQASRANDERKAA